LGSTFAAACSRPISEQAADKFSIATGKPCQLLQTDLLQTKMPAFAIGLPGLQRLACLCCSILHRACTPGAFKIFGTMSTLLHVLWLIPAALDNQKDMGARSRS
jgi:hypothetical protein